MEEKGVEGRVRGQHVKWGMSTPEIGRKLAVRRPKRFNAR
jgi:hypothetical protein